jgi:hypothetical protein
VRHWSTPLGAGAGGVYGRHAMRLIPRRSALLAALCAVVVLPTTATAETGYDPAIAVSPSRFTTADAITVTWRRPAAPTKDDVWTLCRVTGGDCQGGTTTTGTAAATGLAEGRYEFALQAEGVGLFFKGLVDVAIDRTAPGTPTVADWRIPPPTAGGFMRPVITPGEAQNAPIVAVRWTRCTHTAGTTASACIDGRSAPTDVAIPLDPAPLDACGYARASFSASLWLVDAAGNEQPASAATVAPPIPTIACPPPVPPAPPAPPRAVSLKLSGTLRGTPDARRGRMTVAVTPRTATGRMVLRVTPRRGAKRLKVLRATRTVRAGRVSWTGRLPDRTTSLSVVASYAGDARHAPAKRTVVVGAAKR